MKTHTILNNMMTLDVSQNFIQELEQIDFIFLVFYFNEHIFLLTKLCSCFVAIQVI